MKGAGVFRAFDEVLGHLDRLGLFHMDFELDRVRRAASVLGFDRTTTPVIQIVGTNGKGSTASFLASLARAHGLRVGLYTSPHFVTPRERIRINGSMLPGSAWTDPASEVLAAAPELTYFEFLTVLAFLIFVRADVDLMVMEAGLGGRYDATTALRADLVCFTPIALDHEKVLGSTVEAIAADKAGAVRERTPVLTGVQSPEVLQVLERAAAVRQAPLLRAHETAHLPRGVRLGLAGPHQHDNAELALAAWTVLARRIGRIPDPAAVAQGLAEARIDGRLQYIPADAVRGDPPFLLDGGHNPHGLKALHKALKEEGLHPSAVIFSCLADKDIDALLPVVRRIANGAPLYVPTIQDNERAMDGDELAARLGCGAQAFPRLYPALKAAASLDPFPTDDRPVLVCGSLYLLGEFFTLRPQS